MERGRPADGWVEAVAELALLRSGSEGQAQLEKDVGAFMAAQIAADPQICSSDVRMQAVLELLGPRFATAHSETIEEAAGPIMARPALLRPPHFSVADRRRLLDECTQWLVQTLAKARLRFRTEPTALSTAAMQAVEVTLDRECQAYEDPLLRGELLAKRVVEVLQAYPEHHARTMATFVGRVLPNTLRRYLWRLHLHEPQGEKPGDSENQRVYDRLWRDAGDRPPVEGRLLEQGAVQAFGRLPGLRSLSSRDKSPYLCRAAATLRYYRSGVHDPRALILAVPLALIFNDGSSVAESSTDHVDTKKEVIGLASRLDSFFQQALPTTEKLEEWGNIGYARLREAAPDYIAYMERAAARGTLPQERIVNEFLTGSSNANALRNPQLLIQRWTSTIFSGVLSLDAVLYVWDQCGILGWEVLADFTAILLMLLRFEITNVVNDISELRQMLIYSTGLVPTAELIFAHQHVLAGNSLRDIVPVALGQSSLESSTSPIISIDELDAAHTDLQQRAQRLADARNERAAAAELNTGGREDGIKFCLQ